MADDSIPPYSPRIVKIDSDVEVDSLLNDGVDILRRRGNILLCLFPNIPTRSGSVPMKQKTRLISPTLDVAKSHFDAGDIQNGTAVGNPYTGKGIVVGICDIGIDPLHPTFLDANGKSRIKRVVQYVESEGIRLQLDDDDAYRQWATDNPDKFHATHICGILAGGGAGTPYSGIAPDADIVVTVSTLNEVGLLAGVEDIIDYAKEVGKPAVINMSVGNYLGPHDGTSLFSQYLDMCADDAIIVLSSGNEGSNNASFISEFSKERDSISFRLGNMAWDNYHMYGVTQIWSGSDAPLSMSLGLYDSNVRKVVKWNAPLTVTEDDPVLYIWDESESTLDDFPFKGEFSIESEVNPENGRHCTSLYYDYSSEEQSSNGVWARYELAIKISGPPGEDVEVYADAIYSRLAGLGNGPYPSPSRSISDLACGFKIISVGMYGNRDSVPLSGPDNKVFYQPTGFEYGKAVSYSSYGTLRDGRVLPTTVAPGETLMSAGSVPYLEAYPEYPHLRLGDAVWFEGGGTSMSAPYVAGYIATWLEAVPTLTASDVLRIISATNRIDIPEPDDPHNANGYFDPIEGLKLALKEGGVESIENPGIQLDPDDYVEAYDMTGIKRYVGAASRLSCIEKGLYVIKTPYGIKKSYIH